MKEFVIEVKGVSPYATITQVFEENGAAYSKYLELGNMGYEVQWTLHKGISIEEYGDLKTAAIKSVYGE